MAHSVERIPPPKRADVAESLLLNNAGQPIPMQSPNPNPNEYVIRITNKI